MDDLTDNPKSETPPATTDDAKAVVERWLVEDVVPVYDAMTADPGRGIPAAEVTAALNAAHAEWLKKARRGA